MPSGVDTFNSAAAQEPRAWGRFDDLSIERGQVIVLARLGRLAQRETVADAAAAHSAFGSEPGVAALLDGNCALCRDDLDVAHEPLGAVIDAQLAVVIGEGRNARLDGELAGAFARGHVVAEPGRSDEGRDQAHHPGAWGASSVAYFLRSALSRR